MKPNDVVKTPAGRGVYLGEFEVIQDGISETVCLVAVGVSEQARPYMKSETCLDPMRIDVTRIMFKPGEVLPA